jgi:hypothetical protein
MTSSITLYFHTPKIRFLPLLLTKCSYAKKIEAGKLILIIYLGVNFWYFRLGWRGYRTRHLFLTFTCVIQHNPLGCSVHFSYIHVIANILTLVVKRYVRNCNPRFKPFVTCRHIVKSKGKGYLVTCRWRHRGETEVQRCTHFQPRRYMVVRGRRHDPPALSPSNRPVPIKIY